MRGDHLSLTTQTRAQTHAVPHRLSPAAVARRVLQGVGGGAAVGLAAAMPWSILDSDGLTILSMPVPPAALWCFGVVVTTGLCFFAASVWGLVRRLQTHTRWGVGIIALAGCASVFGLEQFQLQAEGFSAQAYRATLRLLCYTAGIALLACSVPEELGPRFAVLIRRKQVRPRMVLAMAGGVVSAGSLIGAYIIKSPSQPDPGLLASVQAHWLFNALIAGTLVVVTYLFVAERADKRLAGLSAVGVALCPWLWIHAGTHQPYVASALCLWLFLWLLVRGVRTRQHILFALSGLAMGGAVLVRPIDALFFALPCLLAAACWSIRGPSIWLTRLPLVALGAIPGIAAWLWANAQQTAQNQAAALTHQSPESALHPLLVMHEGWVALSTHWFAGTAPAALLLLCGVVFGRDLIKGHWLAMLCSASLFLGYALVNPAGQSPLAGPGWYVPLIPAVAMLIAAGFEAASRAGRVRSPSGVLAAGHLRASLVACAVVFGIALPIKLIEFTQQAPGAATQAAGQQATAESAAPAEPD